MITKRTAIISGCTQRDNKNLQLIYNLIKREIDKYCVPYVLYINVKINVRNATCEIMNVVTEVGDFSADEGYEYMMGNQDPNSLLLTANDYLSGIIFDSLAKEHTMSVRYGTRVW